MSDQGGPEEPHIEETSETSRKKKFSEAWIQVRGSGESQIEEDILEPTSSEKKHDPLDISSFSSNENDLPRRFENFDFLEPHDNHQPTEETLGSGSGNAQAQSPPVEEPKALGNENV